MDPFSITAGAIGITGVATASITQLHSLINGLVEANDVVQDAASNLDGIERALATLEQLSMSDEATSMAAKEDLKNVGVAEAVNKCGETCDNFSKDLKKWTKHSSTEKMSIRDRLSVGVWKKEKIRTYKAQLQSCEATVQFAVTSTQLIVQLRSDKSSETDREHVRRQLQTLETKVQEHLDLTKRQQEEARGRERELQEEPEDEEDGGAQRTLAIKELEEQLRILEANQVSCAVVFSKARSRRSGQDIGKVITLDNSKALVGLPESVVGKINQRIGEVRTERRSAAAVGVFSSNISMRDF